MRARRQAVEDELAAPHRAQAAAARQEARRERDTRVGLERLLASPLAKQIMAEHAHMISREIERTITKAVATATKKDPTADIFRVDIPKSFLMFQDRNSIASRVLELYLDDNRAHGPSLSVRADMVPETMSLSVRVTLPALENTVMVYRAHLMAS